MKSTKSLNKAQSGWVYGKIDMDGTLGYFDPMDLPLNYNGNRITLSNLLNRLTTYEQQYELTLKRLEQLKLTLKSFLDRAGYDLPHDTLNDIIGAINSVRVLNPHDKTQIAIMVDEYVNDVIDIKIDQILTNQLIPSDIGGGYHKVVNGKIVEDIKRKEETLMLD